MKNTTLPPLARRTGWQLTTAGFLETVMLLGLLKSLSPLWLCVPEIFSPRSSVGTDALVLLLGQPRRH